MFRVWLVMVGTRVKEYNPRVPSENVNDNVKFNTWRIWYSYKQECCMHVTRTVGKTRIQFQLHI